MCVEILSNGPSYLFAFFANVETYTSTRDIKSILAKGYKLYIYKKK